jgi:hypothetical protein
MLPYSKQETRLKYKNNNDQRPQTIQTKTTKGLMLPHFWGNNLVNSTSLFYHPIHILPLKLYYACNIEIKC